MFHVKHYKNVGVKFTRAIRKNATLWLAAASNASARRNAHIVALPLYIHTDRFSCKHEICLHECTSEVHSRHSQKRHFVAFRCLRSSILLISWRSLRTFTQTDFHVNMKSARMNVRVNWNNITSMFHVKHFL